MTPKEIAQIFNAAYQKETWLQLLESIFSAPQPEIFTHPITTEINTAPGNTASHTVLEYFGTVTTSDHQKLGLYQIEVPPTTALARNRVQLRTSVVKEVKKNALDGALAVYYHGSTWRLSYIAVQSTFSAQGKLETHETPPKRYTYLLGTGANTRTAVQRFSALPVNPSINDLTAACAVETLSQEFYSKLDAWYKRAQTQARFPNDTRLQNHTEISLIRFLTRILFVWFLKEKELICPDLFDLNKIKELIHYQKKSSFYKAVLQNLFFATLNVEINKRDFREPQSFQGKNRDYGNQYRYRYHALVRDQKEWHRSFSRTPFLNGGLFECLDRKATDAEHAEYDTDTTIRPEKNMIRMEGFSERPDNPLALPNNLFFNDDENNLGLIDLFKRYQFTVEESTPADIEVALDPELLGKVFENLLASYNPETTTQARKATGSFYTPRAIVEYMVDESLKQHLRTNTALSGAQIEGLFTDHDEHRLPEQQIKALIKTIDAVKILDPAVGSGAFPMGILQRLISILNYIDPENKYFKEQQLEKAREITDEVSKNAAITAINAVFSQENQHNAYGKKLFLIENCIFGVDIQPVAIQICKLRFLISLTIEQSTNDNHNDNYGIRALPNLEAKFITANTLLPVGKMPDALQQKGLFDATINQLQKNLSNTRHTYFTAKRVTDKEQCRKDDQKLRNVMLKILKENNGITPEIEANMQKIADWDPYNQNTVAHWFDPQWQFGIKSGFDIVIANPPYVQLQKEGGKLGARYKELGYHTFKSSGDIYCLFYERGIQLLKPQAHLCFITSNKWMRAGYGEKLREYLAEYNPLLLMDIGADAFSTATVDTNILLIQQAPPARGLQGVNLGGYQKGMDIARYVQAHQHPLPAPTKKTWFIGTPAEQALKEKIERVGVPLKEWDVQINYGIKTGFNEAFVVGQQKRDDLVAQDPRSAEILKPMLRGRDIKRYGYKWAGLYLIATFPVLKININDYPAIKDYLLSFGKQRLEQSGKKFTDGKNARKKTNNRWFETQDSIDYYKEFEKEKIVYSEIVQKPQFHLDNEKHFPEATSFILTGHYLRFLTAVFNSCFFTYIFKGFYAGGGLGDKGYRYKKQFFEQVPIPPITPANSSLVATIESLVERILAAKKVDLATNTQPWEQEIDTLVYQLYGLTEEEIKVVERQ